MAKQKEPSRWIERQQAILRWSRDFLNRASRERQPALRGRKARTRRRKQSRPDNIGDGKGRQGAGSYRVLEYSLDDLERIERWRAELAKDGRKDGRIRLAEAATELGVSIHLLKHGLRADCPHLKRRRKIDAPKAHTTDKPGRIRRVRTIDRKTLEELKGTLATPFDGTISDDEGLWRSKGSAERVYSNLPKSTIAHAWKFAADGDANIEIFGTSVRFKEIPLPPGLRSRYPTLTVFYDPDLSRADAAAGEAAKKLSGRLDELKRLFANGPVASADLKRIMLGVGGLTKHQLANSLRKLKARCVGRGPNARRVFYLPGQRALVGKVTNRPAEIAPGQSDAQAATSQKRQKAQSDQAPPSTRGRKTDPDSQQRNEICYRVYEVERLKKAIGLQEVRTRLEKIGLGDLAPKHWSHLRGYAKLWAEKNEKSFTRPSQEKARKPQ